MYSHIDNYKIKQGETELSIVVSARRMDNDINGNPRYKAHVWSYSSKSIWSPTIKGFKRCKDDGYVLRGHDDLPDLMKDFVLAFEVTINDVQ